MKAIVFDAARTARLAEVDDPKPGADEVLVRTRLTGVCGSDMHAYHGSQPFFKYPEIPGHEVVGDVVEAGSGASAEPGQRVVLDPTINCGVCRPCSLGRYNCCTDIKVIGVHAPGTFAELFVAPAKRLHVVPDSVSDEMAMLVEPLSIAHHATDRADITPGDTVAIIGGGTIGLSLLLMAQARGGRCAVLDLEESRLALARRMGAELTVNAGERDSVEAMMEWTDDVGVARAFEAVGTPPTIRAAAEMAASAGRAVILGLCAKDVVLPGAMFVRKELEVVGSRLHQNTVEKTLAMLAREEIDPAPMLTEIRPMDAYETALTDLQERPADFIKIGLRP